MDTFKNVRRTWNMSVYLNTVEEKLPDTSIIYTKYWRFNKSILDYKQNYGFQSFSFG